MSGKLSVWLIILTLHPKNYNTHPKPGNVEKVQKDTLRLKKFDWRETSVFYWGDCKSIAFLHANGDVLDY